MIRLDFLSDRPFDEVARRLGAAGVPYQSETRSHMRRLTVADPRAPLEVVFQACIGVGPVQITLEQNECTCAKPGCQNVHQASTPPHKLYRAPKMGRV